MIISEIPNVRLQYEEPLGMLRVAWTAGSAMGQFRSGSKQLAQLCQRLKVRRVLMEMDTLGDISVYDQIWLSIHWLPEIFRLPLERVVVNISSRSIHNQLAVDSLLLMAQPFIRFDVQFFSQVKAGLRWLTDDSPLLALMEAEWNAAAEDDNNPPSQLDEPRGRYLLLA